MKTITKIRWFVGLSLLLLIVPEIMSSDPNSSTMNNSMTDQTSTSDTPPSLTTVDQTFTSSATGTGEPEISSISFGPDELSDNIEWNLIETSNSPDNRTAHEMVYDSVNDVVILFGGFTEDIELDDTWVYNPSSNSWMNMEPLNHPSARFLHKMAFDKQSGKTVLFGGVSGYDLENETYLDDTWTYDYPSNQWTEINSLSKPAARALHSMNYQSSGNRIILFGGSNQDQTFGDMWSFASNTWTLLSNFGSEFSRMGMESVYDSKRDQLIIFGGSNIWNDLIIANVTEDFLYFDFNSNTIRNVSSINTPVNRIGHSMYYDVSSDVVVMFGGYSEGISIPETWIYHISDNTWSYEQYNTPGGLFFSDIVYDTKRDKAVLFGGYSFASTTADSGETWELIITLTEESLDLDLGPFTPWFIGIGVLSLIGIGGYFLYTKFVVETLSQTSSFQDPEELSKPTKDVITSIFGKFTDKYYVIGANFVSKRNVDPELDKIIPDQLYNQKFLMHPMRLAMCRILIEHTRLPTAQLREMMGISWSDLSTHTKAMKDRKLIFVEEIFIGDKAQQVISLEPNGIEQYETLTKMLIELIDQSLLSQEYLNDALKINGDIDEN